MVELAAVLADGEQIEATGIPLRTMLAKAPAAAPPRAADATALVFPSLREQTLAIMQTSLLAYDGDVAAAASRLRVGRSTLYRLIQSGHLQMP